MLINHSNRQFKTTRGSDVHRDGMFLELSEAESSDVLMEIFYSDTDGSFNFAGFECGSVPLDVIEQFILEARHFLPPSPSVAAQAS
ncbi:MAG: hypothetical protein EOP86_11505 [Verrucomicrobiaceae bacterium]|nr:MAG: hypothetical protein EOP86_11505 [Verrucomicrobiaceae bacterium]